MLELTIIHVTQVKDQRTYRFTGIWHHVSASLLKVSLPSKLKSRTPLCPGPDPGFFSWGSEDCHQGCIFRDWWGAPQLKEGTWLISGDFLVIWGLISVQQWHLPGFMCELYLDQVVNLPVSWIAEHYSANDCPLPWFRAIKCYYCGNA